MSFCPNCLTEYESTVTTCVDCNIPLAEGSPSYCPSCEEPVDAGDTFCDSCGVLLLPDDVHPRPDCGVHPEVDAIAGCVVCGTPVCEECAREVEGKYFCADDSHYNVHQKYAVAYTCATEYEAAMIKANLDGAGINALIFNQRDHVYFTTMGSLAIVNVMVPTGDIEKASEIIGMLLAEHESGTEDDASSSEETEQA
jgi:hypothetical protein